MSRKNILFITAGTTFSNTFTYKDEDDDVIDLTGYTANASLRKEYESNTSIAFTVVLGGANGTITISLPATANLTNYSKYVWDVKLTSPSNTVIVPFSGIIYIDSKVT